VLNGGRAVKSETFAKENSRPLRASRGGLLSPLPGLVQVGRSLPTACAPSTSSGQAVGSNLSPLRGCDLADFVSGLERRADMYVSTLQDFVRALGGELKITAKFPEGTVEIRQFEEGGTGKG